MAEVDVSLLSRPPEICSVALLVPHEARGCNPARNLSALRPSNGSFQNGHILQHAQNTEKHGEIAVSVGPDGGLSQPPGNHHLCQRGSCVTLKVNGAAQVFAVNSSVRFKGRNEAIANAVLRASPPSPPSANSQCLEAQTAMAKSAMSLSRRPYNQGQGTRPEGGGIRLLIRPQASPS
ncbi:hypothetical protein GLAREA_01676 [Glarea lozoyensis ATCC 20868]|uniref:Uncharacterized protein n=1 Tax=Glarea lozoyensis (strain ATCC 20868 / MF5171) TaxID=1116229 RepID=S3CKN9_GLAL2|nr:uncharacterized protein GLAREA_01676 [Glarea lozoyensis ATCC 20868]EPE25764.1 hypothetical protein GLAREA_01676 [Glarea lozoyensis ATCC 20868]